MPTIGKFIRNLRQIWIYISEKRKRQLFLLIALSLVSAFAEIITIGLVVPFLAILTNPQVLMEFVHINNFMKYSILFIIVTFSTFFIPNCSIMNQHAVYIGLLAATTFVLLDKYYPSIVINKEEHI
mgnify:CR=1 FL=1